MEAVQQPELTLEELLQPQQMALRAQQESPLLAVERQQQGLLVQLGEIQQQEEAELPPLMKVVEEQVQEA